MEIKTPQEVIEYLGYNTHTILAPEFAERLCQIMGIDDSPPVHEFTNPTGRPKGVDIPPDESITGTSVFALTPFMCHQFGIPTDHGFTGRGSGVRELLKRLTKYFEEKKTSE